VKVLVDPIDNSSVLSQWQGARADVWIFDLSLRKLALLLRKAGADDILYVIGVGCRHITGPFRWDNVKLSISLLSGGRPNTTEESITRLADDDAGFELLCSSDVVLVRGVYPSDIVTSFGEHFLSDSPES